MNFEQAVQDTLRATATGTFVGRVWRADVDGPSVVAIRDGAVWDITSPAVPTMRDLCEQADPASYARQAPGERLGPLEHILRDARNPAAPVRLLAPVDLQALKAAGVTFAVSMLERVIEEKARGDASQAEAIRHDIADLIGDDLSRLVPGSPQAMALKQSLIARGAWSQYLEVGIGPDPEIFTKSQVLSAVGFGADVGIHPMSQWNNPEPEVVVVVASTGRIVGAALGNDVNLRDVEGRSALLLGKAKDNNASCAIGPFIRLFDGTFTLDTVNAMELALDVSHADGFHLRGASNMQKISRSPAALVQATLNTHHQYPDGFVLFCGTLFAPTQDRGGAGQGFTHKHGDEVAVSNAALGVLFNQVAATDACPPWTFGLSHLMRNLARRGLLAAG